MGARFLGVTLVASIVWFAWHWHEYSLARAGVRILILAFAGAVLGKLVGIAIHRFRARMLRDMGSAITRFTHPELAHPLERAASAGAPQPQRHQRPG
jgi:NhaP-type Na+/H+ or K+/H+ antiporter